MSPSIYKKVGFASIIMISSVFLSRIFGILRDIAIADLAGTSGSVDAYQVSFIVPEILNHVLASGFLSITFIPIFTKYLSANKEKESWKVFSNILNTFGILAIGLIFVLYFLAEYFIDLTGLKNGSSYLEAIRMTRIIIPAQFFFFCGGILMAVQFAKERFLIPALAPLIYNLSIILCGVLLYPKLGMEGFSWGVLIGAFLGNFAIQWLGSKSVGMKWFPIINPRHPEFKHYLVLTLPLMIGLTMTFSVEIIPKLFGSYLSEGSVASLNYGVRIMFVLVGLLGQAVGVASYPYLSRLAAENKIAELNHLLNATLKRISLVIPCSFLIIILRKEIVSLLFERGRFDSNSTLMTSDILVFLMIGAFAFTAQTIVNRGFYAIQNTLYPTIYVSIATLLTLPLYYLGMMKMEIYGVALALSMSTIFQVVLLFALWNRKSKNKGGSGVYWHYFKMLVLSIPIALLLVGVKELLLTDVDSFTTAGSLIHLFSISVIFVVLLLGSGYMFRIKEIFDIPDMVYSRIKRIIVRSQT